MTRRTVNGSTHPRPRPRVARSLLAGLVVALLAACGGDGKSPIEPTPPNGTSNVVLSGGVTGSYAGNGYFGIDASTHTFALFLTNIGAAQLATADFSVSNCKSCWVLAVVIPQGTRPAPGSYPFGDPTDLTSLAPSGEWFLTSSDGSVTQLAASRSGGTFTVTASSASEVRGTITMVGTLVDPLTSTPGAAVTITASFVAKCATAVAPAPGVGCG